MNLSKGEKLILFMLADISKKLGAQHEIDPDFVKEAIFSGNTWGLEQRYQFILDGEENDDSIVKEVASILSMWRKIENSYSKLSQDDKDLIKKEAKPFGDCVRFYGFDGNEECSHLSVAGFFINQLDRFMEFKGRDIDSHCPTLDTYRRMLEKYNEIKQPQLTAVQIIDVLKERIHPDNR